jgi:hypothetical protein
MLDANSAVAAVVADVVLAQQPGASTVDALNRYLRLREQRLR